MEDVNKIEYKIRDLGTRTVTLFPTRATVVRDIKDVPLKPGANQITIVGLSPTVDEHSIKVEGTGSATITDISIELLRNREIFEEIYPEEESENETEESEDDEEEAETESPALKKVRADLQALRDRKMAAREVVASAESRLRIIDDFGKTMNHEKKSVVLGEGLGSYKTEREAVFKDHMDGTVAERDLLAQIAELTKEERRLIKEAAKVRAKAQREKEKAQKIKEREREKKARRDADIRKEKERVQAERTKFWPKQVYSVRISLDAAVFTPSSSRRGSIASDVDLFKEPAKLHDAGNGKAGGDPSSSADSAVCCDLTLSYVTGYAYWAPNYDLSLSTTTNVGNLCFDARLTNQTSEEWRNCKVILSTSQTNFSSLNDTLPTLVPWHVKILPKTGRGGVHHFGAEGGNVGTASLDILDSREERQQKNAWQQSQKNIYQTKDRNELFGKVAGGAPQFAVEGRMQRRSAPMPNADFLSSNALPPPPPMASMPMQAGLFGSAAPMQAQQQQAVMREVKGAPRMAKKKAAFFSSGSAAPGGGGFGGGGSSDGDEDEDGVGAAADDGATIAEDMLELGFGESSFEETGMTSTYDLPGLKTLAPSSTASKQRVARVAFQNVVFSHTVVAKYTPAAYLKAKLRNASKLTLLKGAAGLTLDGSFMGRTTLPRCSAGDSFTMSLGIDPAIKVAYPKPDIKRSTTGIISKEDSSVYTRAVTLVNTRASAGKPVQLTVLDQVPVSEDARLRIDVLQPAGVARGGPVAAGVPGKDSSSKDWGKATATLKKGGEVAWDVQLNAGKSVKLLLEYEVALPVGETVIQC